MTSAALVSKAPKTLKGVGPGFQVPFVVAVKQAVWDRLAVSAVGSINSGRLASKIVEEDGLDLAFVGLGFQRDTGMAWAFAAELGVEISMASQIRWGFSSRWGSPYLQPDAIKKSASE